MRCVRPASGRNPRDVTPPQYQISRLRRTRQHSSGRDFAGWVGQLVGRQGWHCFAARANGAIIATAALYAANGAGWLGSAATLEQRRRRGAQSALLAARVEHALALGVTTLVTDIAAAPGEAPGPSHRNIVRAATSGSPLTDSNRQPPPYHPGLPATGRNYRRLVVKEPRVFRSDGVAVIAGVLRPLCSTNAPYRPMTRFPPSAAVETADRAHCSQTTSRCRG
jgi:GNAT superfamily N-acetyltransferase